VTEPVAPGDEPSKDDVVEEFLPMHATLTAAIEIRTKACRNSRLGCIARGC
jgi:hypothetical protein